MIILPEFYETHLKRELGRAEYLLLKILINLLQFIKTVSIESLSTALPIPILFESRRKKIQRFLSLNYINVEEMWLVPQYLVKKLNAWVSKNMLVELKKLGGLFAVIVVFILDYMDLIGSILWKILTS